MVAGDAAQAAFDDVFQRSLPFGFDPLAACLTIGRVRRASLDSAS